MIHFETSLDGILGIIWDYLARSVVLAEALAFLESRHGTFVPVTHRTLLAVKPQFKGKISHDRPEILAEAKSTKQ